MCDVVFNRCYMFPSHNVNPRQEDRVTKKRVFSVRTEIEITQDDIANSDRLSGFRNAVATSISRHVEKEYDVFVGRTHVKFLQRKKSDKNAEVRGYRWDMDYADTYDLWRYVVSYLDGIPTLPRTLTIEIPIDILKA